MNEKVYIVEFAVWLGRALGQSSANLFTNFHSDALGKNLPLSVTEKQSVITAVTMAADAGVELDSAADDLSSALGDDESALVNAFISYAQAVVEYVVAVDNLISELNNAVSSGAISDPGKRSSAEALLLSLSRKILDFVIISGVELVDTRILFFLKLIGIVDWQFIEEDEADPLSQPYVVKELHLERIKSLFTDPVGLLESNLGWGAPDFDPSDVLEIVASFNSEENEFSLGEKDGDPIYTQGPLSVRRDSTLSPPGLKILYLDSIEESIQVVEQISDDWNLTNESSITFTGGVSTTITPPFSIDVKPDTGEVSGQTRLFVNRNEARRPFDVVGGNGLINLSLDDISFGVGLEASWDALNGKAGVNPLVFSDLKGATLRIGSEDSDSFIGSLLSAADIEGTFDVGLEWSLENGLKIKASGGIEIALPVHLSLGFVDIDTIFIVLKINDDGSFTLETSAEIIGNLGPLVAAVERMGAELDLVFPDDGNARFGPFDLDLHFKPPTGVGLSLDVGVVKGGGFLRFDPDKEEYDGILELDLNGIVSVKAIGLITTKMPDGSKGFSLLLIITAEFGSPIQLGFGFTLSGVGGLLGLNRTMRLEEIATGIRDGGINSIMFPQNVIENAPRIISDLKKYFPVEEGTFLIGPMVKIGWGTPNLVTVSLGVIIEIPGNIAILGVLKVALPDEDAALIVIQVNFIGAIEFDKKRLWFFASIFESRVLFITLEGEMGLLVGWGDDASFVVSVGGFHPAFDPPALPFGAIARIAISILNTDFARIRVEGYFAVTSNTVQFGAKVEIYFGVSAFNIDGHLAFDALFRFSPFYFIITISASLSVKVFGIGLFSVRMRGSLEGPTPWHVEGTGSISLFFFDIDVDFSHTWGNEEETTLPPISVMPLLKAELEKMENWLASLPDSSQLLVSLREFEQGTTDLILHPVGSLKVSQRFVPLDLTIDKVGNQKPSDANKFSVTVDTGSDSELDEVGIIEESFATGQYLNKSDDSLLSSKSYEPIKSGVEIAVEGEQYSSPMAVKRVVRYEEIIIDTQFKRYVKTFFAWFGTLFDLFLNGNSVSKSALSFKQKKKLQPFSEKVEVGKALYGVAFNSDNTAFNNQSVNFTSKVKAEEYLKQQLKNDGNLKDELHVIPQVEMREAA